MIIMGIDPGYAIVGFGVIAKNHNVIAPVSHGVITTKAGTELSLRLQIIYEQMNLLLAKHKPDCLAIEKLFFNTNNKTAIDVAQARGVLLLCVRQAGIPIFEYTPLQVKTALTGYGRAVKTQVQEMTCRLLKLKEIPKPDDAADALAMAICHANVAGSMEVRRRLSK